MQNPIESFKNIIKKTPFKIKSIVNNDKKKLTTVTIGDNYDNYRLTLQNNGDVFYTNDNVKLGNLYSGEEELVSRLQENINEIQVSGSNNSKTKEEIFKNIKKEISLDLKTSDPNQDKQSIIAKACAKYNVSYQDFTNWAKSTIKEMSMTGGGASFQGGPGLGVATKKAFKGPKSLLGRKKRNKMKLSSLLNEIKDEIEEALIPKPKVNVQYSIQNRINGDWEGPYTFKNVSPNGFYNFFDDQKGLLSFKKSVMRKMIDSKKIKHYSLTEGITYSKFRNEVKTRTKQQQIHRSIKEVQKRLSEVNKVLEFTNRMRGELSENGGDIKYSRFTEQALGKIKGMVAELYGNIKKLKK